ncbi:MAG: hypothetical protein IH862_09115 [Chloroflexi bacterium]|nr:hypothetical protein [Chloroflexota bacterium]
MTSSELLAATVWATRSELAEDRRPPARAPMLAGRIPSQGQNASAASIPGSALHREDVHEKAIVRTSA